MVALILAPFILGVLWIIYNVLQMPKLSVSAYDATPLVSICIPLRNEQHRAQSLIENVQQLSYAQLEILLYDDDSTDDTFAILQDATAGDTRFRLLRGGPLPAGWKGKPHACWQLAQAAKGTHLLFIDADVTLRPDTVQAFVSSLARTNSDALTGFPRFQNDSILERLLTPLLHFFVHMHLPIAVANGQRFPLATAASGAFIGMTKDCYEAIGGHTCVKDAVVEDVALFRACKTAGKRATIFHITAHVSCAMYGSSRATWDGFLKNCFAGFGHSYVLGLAVLGFYASYYIMPGVLLVLAFSQGWLFAVPYLCITCQRFVSDLRARQLSFYTFLMPLSALCYCLLLVTAMVKRARNHSTTWKGRAL